jgi:hypothetical protein
MLKMSGVAACLLLISVAPAIAGENPNAKLAMHLDCTIAGAHRSEPDCGGEPEGGGDGTGTLRVEEVCSAGEGALPAGVTLPVRAMWAPTPGVIRLFRPDGEFERDIQLPSPAGGGFLSSLSDDGSIAIVRTGVSVRCGGPLLTRVFDLKEERILFEGESSGNETFWPSPGGEMVLHNHLARSSSLLRRDLSLLRSTNSEVVKWDFCRQYLATLEVDLVDENGSNTRSSLPFPPIKGPLRLRVYDLRGNTVLEEFLDGISAGIDIDIEDEGTVAALYRKFDVAYWTPPGTYPSSDFVLVVGRAQGLGVGSCSAARSGLSAEIAPVSKAGRCAFPH